MGYAKTALLLAAMTALFLIAGYVMNWKSGDTDRLGFCGGHQCFCLLEFRPNGVANAWRAGGR